MKSWFQAAALLITGVSALALPSLHHNSPDQDITIVAGSTDSNHVGVHFTIPYKDVTFHENGDLKFELEIHAAAHGCNTANITLNGSEFVQQGGKDDAYGNIVFQSTTSNGDEREVFAAWTMTCLPDEVQLLTVKIYKLSGGPGNDKILSLAGFSTSFSRSSSPRIVRLQNRPLVTHQVPHILDDWVNVKERYRVKIIEGSLEQNFLELEAIKLQIHKLHEQYNYKESTITEMIKSEFKTCDTMRCVIKTAKKEAPGVFELLKAHFRHRPDISKLSSSGGMRMHGDQGRMYQEFDGLFHDDPDRAHQHEDSPVPGFDGPPPFPKFSGPSHPPGLSHPPPPFPHDHPPHSWTHSSDHGRPQFDHHHRRPPHHRPMITSIGILVLIILVLSMTYKFLSMRTTIFKDPILRRDRLARREECRTRAAYRRAACQYRVKSWWSRFRQPESTNDYDEKRSRIISQERTLEDVMQNEIRDLRRAHEIVGDLMRAEEGRQRLYHDVNFNPNSTAMFGGEGSTSASMTSTSMGGLPPYQSPPPSYEADLEGELTVVDGFRYTPSNTDDTPESSVIDCNSRISFETGSTVPKDT